MKSKASKKELQKTLAELLDWSTCGDRTGNPYCKDEVKNAIEVLARSCGSDETWSEFDFKTKFLSKKYYGGKE